GMSQSEGVVSNVSRERGGGDNPVAWPAHAAHLTGPGSTGERREGDADDQVHASYEEPRPQPPLTWSVHGTPARRHAQSCPPTSVAAIAARDVAAAGLHQPR